MKGCVCGVKPVCCAIAGVSEVDVFPSSANYPLCASATESQSIRIWISSERRCLIVSGRLSYVGDDATGSGAPLRQIIWP